MNSSERVKTICDNIGAALTLSPTATEADWDKWLASYEKRPPAEEGERRCVVCASEMVKREGKFGAFWGCARYPACRYTENE